MLPVCKHKVIHGSNQRMEIDAMHLSGKCDKLWARFSPIAPQATRIAPLPVNERRCRLNNPFVKGCFWLDRLAPACFPLLMSMPECLIIEQAHAFEEVLRYRCWVMSYQ